MPRYERLSADDKTNLPKEARRGRIIINDDIDLDNTVVHSNNAFPLPHIEAQTRTVKSSHKVVNLAISNLTLVTLFLTLSICLTFYQKWILKSYKYPLTITSYHLVIKLIMSLLVRWVYKVVTGKSRILLDARTSLKTMAPTGCASGIDIGFSQWGLELVQVSLYTMTKSSTIIFILFFAILLGLEKKSWSLVIIVVLISSGLFLFTYKSTEFNLVGFFILLFASFTSGIRWSLAQLVMQKAKIGLHNPIDMIFHMQPWMILALLPLAVGFEGSSVLQKLLNVQEASYDKTLYALFKISVGAVIAFLMEISEFLVLSRTSSLTLSIAGIFKEILQLVLAVELYNDKMTGMNILGLIMCLGGICCHLIHKYSIILKNEIQMENDESSGNIITHGNGIVKSSQQRVPLLDSKLLETDSDEDDSNEQTSSEVIFDVLKRRDATR